MLINVRAIKCQHFISFDLSGLWCAKTSRQMWRTASCSFSIFWLLSCKVTYPLFHGLRHHFGSRDLLLFASLPLISVERSTYTCILISQSHFHTFTCFKKNLISRLSMWCIMTSVDAEINAVNANYCLSSSLLDLCGLCGHS